MMQLATFITRSNAPATRLQRSARRWMLTACAILGLGIVGSVAANAVDGKQPPTRFVQTRESLTIMATNRSASVAGGIELMHDSSASVHSRIVKMNVTAYCPCPKCCGAKAQGITASGKLINFDNGHFVAAPAEYTFGTNLIIPGYNNGQPVKVLDRGGAIKGNHLDVFFPTHEQAKQWGRQQVDVQIIE